MKTIQHLRNAERGFSLIELIVAMGISMILLAALASIFAQSIKSREFIDKEGRKIDSARYSLDTLAEDIRLAGYYGNYSPPVTGATPADWKYVDPCSVTGGSPLPGWNATTSPVQVPFPIFGYEAHGTGTLPAGLTGCLDNPRANTDVFVIRRASTSSVTAGGAGYVAGDTYLQVSSCPVGTVDTQPFHAKATTTSADFNLHILGCTASTPGTNAVVRKLITRIYYISTCDDCTGGGDGIPTLKMVELRIPDSGGTTLGVVENLRTIAPGVENMHIEYGVDLYSLSGVPTGAADGSVEAWLVSNNDPLNDTGGTPVSNPDPIPPETVVREMRVDAGENRWEDVMAVKLFLVTRDLQPTTGYTDAKTFVMGSKTVAAAGDAYRRRLTSSTIKLVNMSGRREVP